MSIARLRTSIWVQALVWRCSQAGTATTVVRRGDADAGTVLIKINKLGAGFDILFQSQAADGAPIWQKAMSSDSVSGENEIDAYIGRQVARDPDIWVIEIETRNAGQFLDGNTA